MKQDIISPFIHPKGVQGPWVSRIPGDLYRANITGGTNELAALQQHSFSLSTFHAGNDSYWFIG